MRQINTMKYLLGLLVGIAMLTTQGVARDNPADNLTIKEINRMELQHEGDEVYLLITLRIENTNKDLLVSDGTIEVRIEPQSPSKEEDFVLGELKLQRYSIARTRNPSDYPNALYIKSTVDEKTRADITPEKQTLRVKLDGDRAIREKKITTAFNLFMNPQSKFDLYFTSRTKMPTQLYGKNGFSGPDSVFTLKYAPKARGPREDVVFD
jgi:hypothetical protein